MENEKKKKLIASIGAAIGGISGISVATYISIYDKAFKRYERPDYNIYPGLYNYALVKSKINREECDFYSDDILLKGYYYPKKHAKGLVVFAHGMHAGADDYLPLIIKMLENGYAAFAFDYKGTYNSSGDSTVGMCESLVDLDHALDFIASDSRFKNLKIYLIGHSWGGYAVTSILSLKHNISGVASIAGFYDGYTLIYEKAKQYSGSLAAPSKPMAELYHKYLFKDYTNYNSIKGINGTNIPVLIAHGVDDEVILFNEQSVIAHKNEITNKNVSYYVGLGLQGTHNGIWHSNKAIIYQKEVASKLKLLEIEKKHELTYQEKVDFYSKIDHNLYSEVNNNLLVEILKVFK